MIRSERKVSRRRLVIALAGLLALPLSAGADSSLDAPSDLSGTWRTVQAESESMEPVMKAQGIPWLQRKAARMVSLEFIFRQEGGDLEQEMQSSFTSGKRKYRMNGPEYDDEDFRGRTMRARDWWTESGDFARRMVYESGVVLTIQRRLRDDGRHIDVRFDVEEPGRETQTVKRVLRRVDDGEGR